MEGLLSKKFLYLITEMIQVSDSYYELVKSTLFKN